MKPTKQQVNSYELHVRLIMQKHGVAKSKACMIAWMEGPEGLKNYLHPELPLEGGEMKGKTDAKA